jgi:hypothetical protein
MTRELVVIHQVQCFECHTMFPFVDLRRTSHDPAILEGFKEPNHCPTCFAMLFGPAARELSHGNAEANLYQNALAG